LANAFNQETVRYSRIGGAASLGLLICLILFSFPAAAEVYPVSGVWTAIDTDFPHDPKIARHAALGHMNDYDLENQSRG
jgi:hypothetical protein